MMGTIANSRPRHLPGKFAGLMVAAVFLFAAVAAQAATNSCQATVYLTIDTGHMGPAEEMAATLNRHQVKATFFLANENTQRGDTSLDLSWRTFWKARADEGHGFGSHTWRHWYFRGDVGTDKVRYVPWSAQQGALLDQAQALLYPAAGAKTTR